MLSNHRIQMTLKEITEISRIELALYNEDGKLLASTFAQKENFEAAVRDFAESMAESQTFSGIHFFKVFVEEKLANILLVKSSGEEAYMVGKLAVCQVRHLVEMYREQFDKNNFMQNIDRKSVV